MYFPKPAINENDLAIIERGDTASHSIEAGQYVSWKGKLGKAVSAILQGATLDDSLFSYDTDGVINSLSNNFKWVCLLQPTSISNDSTATLSDSIENYDELFIQMHVYVSASTAYRRACVGVIPVAAIKAYGYDTNNQFIISCIGSVNAESSKLNYAEYTQFSFINATTLKINFREARGWSGSYYFTVYAR